MYTTKVSVVMYGHIFMGHVLGECFDALGLTICPSEPFRSITIRVGLLFGCPFSPPTGFRGGW